MVGKERETAFVMCVLYDTIRIKMRERRGLSHLTEKRKMIASQRSLFTLF